MLIAKRIRRFVFLLPGTIQAVERYTCYLGLVLIAVGGGICLLDAMELLQMLGIMMSLGGAVIIVGAFRQAYWKVFRHMQEKANKTQ